MGYAHSAAGAEAAGIGFLRLDQALVAMTVEDAAEAKAVVASSAVADALVAEVTAKLDSCAPATPGAPRCFASACWRPGSARPATIGFGWRSGTSAWSARRGPRPMRSGGPSATSWCGNAATGGWRPSPRCPVPDRCPCLGSGLRRRGSWSRPWPASALRGRPGDRPGAGRGPHPHRRGQGRGRSGERLSGRPGLGHLPRAHRPRHRQWPGRGGQEGGRRGHALHHVVGHGELRPGLVGRRPGPGAGAPDRHPGPVPDPAVPAAGGDPGAAGRRRRGDGAGHDAGGAGDHGRHRRAGGGDPAAAGPGRRRLGGGARWRARSPRPLLRRLRRRGQHHQQRLRRHLDGGGVPGRRHPGVDRAGGAQLAHLPAGGLRPPHPGGPGVARRSGGVAPVSRAGPGPHRVQVRHRPVPGPGGGGPGRRRPQGGRPRHPGWHGPGLHADRGLADAAGRLHPLHRAEAAAHRGGCRHRPGDQPVPDPRRPERDAGGLLRPGTLPYGWRGQGTGPPRGRSPGPRWTRRRSALAPAGHWDWPQCGRRWGRGAHLTGARPVGARLR